MHGRRFVMAFRWFAAALLLGLAVPASAETYFGFRTGIMNAPPAPVVLARAEPHLIIVPYTRIYKVKDSTLHLDGDMFLFAGYWYIFRSGFWYQARTLRGPYRVVDARQVPREILI